MTLEEFAETTRQALSTVYKSRLCGEGPIGFKVGKRILVTEEELERYLEARREEA